MSFTDRIVFGFDGKKPSKEFLEIIDRSQPAGIILFERNIAGLSEIKKLIKQLKAVSHKSYIMIDEEGGCKSRLRAEHGFPNAPDPREISSRMDIFQAREAFRLMGEALLDLGIEVDLAPVIDVAAENHILGNRAFSEKAQVCSDYGAAAVEGLISAGVYPCAKHFPGLGSADIDPHLKTSIAGDSADFDGEHFIPFRGAIKAGVPAIMTTHLRAKRLDPTGTNATYSKPIVKILREKLGFRGIIISDDLFMGGAEKGISILERTKRSLIAGHDMVLICREFQGQNDFLDEIEKAGCGFQKERPRFKFE